MKYENEIQSEVLLRLSDLGMVMFRNNLGFWIDDKGHAIKYGVCNPGGSDLIGWMSVEITPDMVGQKVAIFTACEVKRPGRKATNDQQNFITVLNSGGGVGFVAHSQEEAEELAKWPKS